jgi:O-antigen ligase
MLEKFSVFAVAVVAASVGLTTTIDFGLAPTWWDEQRIVLLLVLLLVSSAGFALQTARGRLSIGSVLAVGVPLAFGTLSALQAPRPFVALLDVATYTAIAWYALLFIGTPRRSLAIGGAIFAIAVAGPYVFGVVARYFSALLLSMPIGADTLLVGFANPRFPAHLQALTIPLFPLALTLVRGPFAQPVLMATGALWWMCAIGSGSRTAWMALVAAAAVALLLEGLRGKWLRIQLRLGAAGAALYALGFWAIPRVVGLASTAETGRLSEFASVGARVELWSSSWKAIAADPWLGLGPMHFAYPNNGIAAHPHNFWLQIAAEWGIAACIVLVGTSTLLWLRSVSLARVLQLQCADGRGVQDDAVLAVGIATAITAWIVAIQADGVMVVPTSQAVSAIVLGLACGLVVRERSERLRPAILHAVAAIFFLPAAVVLISLPFTSFWHVNARQESWLKANPGGTMAPRFWQQGWIGPEDDPTARSDVQRR